MNSYNGFSPGQRQKAFDWYKAQLAGGGRVKPSECEACGSTTDVNGHSEDYSEPFGDHIGQIALCFCCHMMVHNRFNNPSSWREYIMFVENGWMFPDIKSWGAFRGHFLGVSQLNAPRVKAPNVIRQPVLALIDSGAYYPGHDSIASGNGLDSLSGRVSGIF